MKKIGKVAIVVFGTGEDFAGKPLPPRDVADGLQKISEKLGNVTILASEGRWLNSKLNRIQEEHGRTVFFVYDGCADLEDKSTFIRDTLRQAAVSVIVADEYDDKGLNLYEH